MKGVACSDTLQGVITQSVSFLQLCGALQLLSAHCFDFSLLWTKLIIAALMLLMTYHVNIT